MVTLALVPGNRAADVCPAQALQCTVEKPNVVVKVCKVSAIHHNEPGSQISLSAGS